MKKIKVIIFFITIMLSRFCRTNIVEAASDSIYCGELPKDGSPLVVTYSLEPADERLNGNKYIIFTITKTSVTWTCVDIPINWSFRGEMSILNQTTGMYSGQNMTMSGRSGTFGYYSIPGHTYRMHFNGLFYIVDASGKIIALASNEYESGSWSWKVPLN